MTDKPFYKMNHKNKERDVIEYSTNFDFFYENQVLFIESQEENRRHIVSHLESKNFKTRKIVNAIALYQPNFSIKDFREIHREILEGKHGEGKLVD